MENTENDGLRKEMGKIAKRKQARLIPKEYVHEERSEAASSADHKPKPWCLS